MFKNEVFAGGNLRDMEGIKILHCTDGSIRKGIYWKTLNLTETFQMIETLHSLVFVKL